MSSVATSRTWEPAKAMIDREGQEGKSKANEEKTGRTRTQVESSRGRDGLFKRAPFAPAHSLEPCKSIPFFWLFPRPAQRRAQLLPCWQVSEWSARQPRRHQVGQERGSVCANHTGFMIGRALLLTEQDGVSADSQGRRHMSSRTGALSHWSAVTGGERFWLQMPRSAGMKPSHACSFSKRS